MPETQKKQAQSLGWEDPLQEEMATSVKNLPAMQATWTQFLDRDHPLEKEMATHSSILAWKVPWTEEPGRLQSIGSQKVRHD